MCLRSQDLFVLFVLIDSAIPPQQIDLDFVNWCGVHRVPTCTHFHQDRQEGNQEQISRRIFRILRLPGAKAGQICL